MKILPCETFEEAKQIVEESAVPYDALDVAGYPTDFVWWKFYPYAKPNYKVAHFNAKEKKLYLYDIGD